MLSTGLRGIQEKLVAPPAFEGDIYAVRLQPPPGAFRASPARHAQAKAIPEVPHSLGEVRTACAHRRSLLYTLPDSSMLACAQAARIFEGSQFAKEAFGADVRAARLPARRLRVAP